MFSSALQRRVARLGAQPLITFYDGADGSRIELSAVTFANWVDKTANLIVDLGHEDGEPIDIALAETHPGHWVTLVWIAAAWQRGCPVNSDATGSSLLVVGPDDDRRAETTVACSLHPLGRGFATPPTDAVDYVEVFAQPDAHDRSPLATEDRWDATPVPRAGGRDTRLLIADPEPGWQTFATAVFAPALGTGSSVIVVGMSADQVTRVATTENAILLSDGTEDGGY